MTLRYLVDSAGDHTANYLEMVDECSKEFDDINELMVFASECTSPINVSEFIPEIDFEMEDLTLDIDSDNIEHYSDFNEYSNLEELL